MITTEGKELDRDGYVRITYTFPDGSEYYIEGEELEKFRKNMECFVMAFNYQAGYRPKLELIRFTPKYRLFGNHIRQVYWFFKLAWINRPRD